MKGIVVFLLLSIVVVACGDGPASAPPESRPTDKTKIEAEAVAKAEQEARIKADAQEKAEAERKQKEEDEAKKRDEESRLSSELKEYLDENYGGATATSWYSLIKEVSVSKVGDEYTVDVKTDVFPDEEGKKVATPISGAVLVWGNVGRKDIYIKSVRVVGSGNGLLTDRKNHISRSNI